MNAVVVIVGVILIIIIWCYFDFTLGRKRHLSAVSQKETGILHSHFDIFTHGKELFHDYFEEIHKARHHIHVLFYIVKDDRFSQEFLRLLMEKAREGVEVRLLLDRIGSWKITRKTVKELEAEGVKFAFSDKIHLPFLFYSSQVRNHRKITIIDGKVGYLGGFNIGKEYIDEKPKLSPWRDYHLKITGEGAGMLQSEFFSDWNRSTKEVLPGATVPDGAPSRPASQPHDLMPYFPKLEKGEVRHQFVPTEAGHLEDRFIKLLQKAEKKIMICTPYFIPSKRLFAVLMAAMHRGVKVTLVVPYTADHALVQEASYRYLRKLLRAGAAVYQFKNGFYHAKTLIIDDTICDVGTANFDKRSLYLNKEINCYLYDPAFITRMNEVLQKDLLDSEQLTLEAINTLNPGRTLKEIIAAPLSIFL